VDGIYFNDLSNLTTSTKKMSTWQHPSSNVHKAMSIWPSINIVMIGGMHKNEKIQQKIVVRYDRFYHNNSHIEIFP